MKYCKKCVMPDTRPGIKFNESGVCAACTNFEKRKNIDWASRLKELEKICDKYRSKNARSYDCMIAVSGGKDSHFQVHVMKEKMGMNPLLVSVSDNFKMTEAGKHNIKNISEAFGCHLIQLNPDIKAQKKTMRATFEKYGKPTWFIDRLIYTYPLHMAVQFNIPLLVYGENVSFEYGGDCAEETYSAKDLLSNGVASDIPFSGLADCGITEKDLILHNPPSKKELEKIDPIYLSYFIEWNSVKNFEFAKTRGFKSLEGEWERSHHVENFDQIDSPAYLVHSWMKYPKFGHQAATDYSARFIRYGITDRASAIKTVAKKDHNLDKRSISEFCEFTGYTEKEFWDIADKFYNRDIFEKGADGKWKLKTPLS
ncbi:N-acetyl sugar amidotransferase [Parelusimicrobium proximum]|uniref:N-acetyl sugar amidotransferase n=1 Tax=Parelusimicrobium proximum TaxID=3228953 RepID=UPI003D1791D2